jgi:neutral ceramidase
MAVDSVRDGGLSAGAGAAEITPPLEVGLLMSSVDGRWAEFEGVRKPLQARALVIESRGPGPSRRRRSAIVALDLLALSGKALGGFKDFKARISEASGGAVGPDEIVLACTHTHTAPESGAITDLYMRSSFESWIELVVAQVGKAIAAAATALKPCDIACGSTTVAGLGIHRRYKTTNGVLMSHPEPPADIILSRDGAVDDSVNVLSFRDKEGRLTALLVNATCHPVYEMCIPHVSPDYPGELCSLLEQRYPDAHAIFLNGAAGNVNPQGVSSGPDAAKDHANKLAASVEQAIDASFPVASPKLLMRRRSLKLPTRLPSGIEVGHMLSTEIVAVSLGDVALIFLAGEPFAETALAIRSNSPFRSTFVVGLSEETIGYIPTDEAFSEGGYEIGFGPWSVLAPGSEGILRHESQQLLGDLIASAEELTGEAILPAPHAFGTNVGDGRQAHEAADLARTAFTDRG